MFCSENIIYGGLCSVRQQEAVNLQSRSTTVLSLARFAGRFVATGFTEKSPICLANSQMKSSLDELRHQVHFYRTINESGLPRIPTTSTFVPRVYKEIIRCLFTRRHLINHA